MTRRPMPDEIRARIDELLAISRRDVTGDAEVWSALEDAHVLSQPWARTHMRVHWTMLTRALRARDPREVAGQVSRLLLAGPGSITGRYPTGNTGRARVSAFEPMPIRDDLTVLLTLHGDEETDDGAG